MKNLLLSLIFGLLSFMTFSQTPVNVYVINQNGCPYSVTTTWTNPILGGGNGNFVSVDSLAGQEVWHFSIPDTSNNTLFTVCVIPAPPCNCPLICAGPMPIYPNISITLELCQNVGINELTGNSKQLVSVVDLMGRETKIQPNKVLIYTYSDGSKEIKYINE
jgi:hypothetical protein